MGHTNFFYLLIGLLFLLFAIPLAHDFEILSAPLAKTIAVSVLMLLGIWSLRGGRHFFTVGMVVVIASIVLNTLSTRLDSPVFEYGAILTLIGFLLIAISFTLQQVLFGTEMNANRLVGAICVFLLLGVLWAFAYTLLELLIPGSFEGLTGGQIAGWDNDWLYFSFVTLTTLGYGDITPLSATARSLAYLQAVAGQFYIAILVAGLVSAYISDKQGP